MKLEKPLKEPLKNIMKKINKLTKKKSDETLLPILEKRIKEREGKIQQERKLTLFHASKTIEMVIEQGQDLLTAKRELEHGNWLLWLEKNFPGSHDTASRYMGLASNFAHMRNLDNDISIRKAMIAAGIIPENNAEPKPLGFITVSPIISRLNFVAEWVARSGDEIANWEKIRRDELKLQLQPVVELFQKL